MEIGLVVLAALLAVAVLALVLTRVQTRQIDPVLLDERLDSLNRLLGEVSGQTSTYQETLTAVNQALGGLTQTSHRMLEVGRDMQKLQELLAAPTLRGGVGELMLEGMLRQTLPSDFYETQFTFRNGNRVDAVLRLASGLVSVDAKFPLESFRRLTEVGDTERGRHIGQFRRDMRRHIDDIAEKYICPGETLDFALMYIPAENVYYEIVLKADKAEDILSYAWEKRVFPTSPNSFYAYLQIIALGLRGLQVEESAKHILDSLARLKGDFERFVDDYRLVGTHLGRAQAKHAEGLPKLESIQRTLPGELTSPPSDRPSMEQPTVGSAQEPLE